MECLSEKIMNMILISAVLIIMIFVSGCEYKSKSELEDEEISSVVIALVGAMTEKDSQIVSSYLTNSALNTVDLDKGMDYTFNNFKGDVISVTKRNTHVKDSWDSGKHTKSAYVRYNIITNTNEYVLSFLYYLKDTKNHNQYKISHLKLSNTKDITDSFEHNYAWEYSRCGIYNNEWDTEN